MSQPKPDKLPRWASVAVDRSANSVTDGTSLQASVREPPDAIKDGGFTPFLAKPRRAWVNWLLQKGYQYLGWLGDQTREGFDGWSGVGWVSGRDVTAGAGFSVNVSAGEEWLGGERQNDAAVTGLGLTDIGGSPTDNFVYADTDRAAKITTTVATAFANGRLPLAVVRTNGAGGITSITHIRAQARPHRPYITVGPNGHFTDLATALTFARHASPNAPDKAEVVITGAVTVPAKISISWPVRIRGVGRDARLLWTFDDACLDLGGSGGADASGSEFLDLRFEYGGAASTLACAIGQLSGNAEKVLVRNCSVLQNSAGNKIRAGIRATASAKWWRVQGCLFEASSLGGGFIDAIEMGAGTEGWIVSGNSIHNVGDTGNRGIHVSGGTGRHVIAGNKVRRGEDGIRLAAPECTVSGNVCEDCQDGGIECTSGGTSSAINGNLVINCNTVSSTDGAVHCSADDCTLVGNVVKEWNWGFAIVVTGRRTIVSQNHCLAITMVNILGGIQCNPAAGSNDWFVVSGNLVDLARDSAVGAGVGDAVGIKMGPYSVTGGVLDKTANTADRAQIIGNIVRNVGADAGSGYGIGIDASGESSICGNQLYNVRGIGIRVDGPETSVADNTFVSCASASSGGVGISGITIEAAAHRCTIHGNRFPTFTQVGSSGCIGFVSGVLNCFAHDNILGSGSKLFAGALEDQHVGTLVRSASFVGAGPDILLQYTPGNSRVLSVECLVTAERTDVAGEAAGYRLWAVFKINAGGTVTQIGSTVVDEREDVVGWIAALTSDATTIKVQVTGEGGKTIFWRAQMKLSFYRDNYPGEP